MKFRPL
jgi:hypothetical protein